MSNIITKNTLVPISLVVVIISASSWMTTIWYTGNANAAVIKEIQTSSFKKDSEVIKVLGEIKERLARIEEALKRK